MVSNSESESRAEDIITALLVALKLPLDLCSEELFLRCAKYILILRCTKKNLILCCTKQNKFSFTLVSSSSSFWGLHTDWKKFARNATIYFGRNMPGPLDKTQNTTHSPILFPPVSTPSHNCQALVPSTVVLDPIPNQSKIQVQLGLGVTLKSHGPPPPPPTLNF